MEGQDIRNGILFNTREEATHHAILYGSPAWDLMIHLIEIGHFPQLTLKGTGFDPEKHTKLDIPVEVATEIIRVGTETQGVADGSAPPAE